MVFEFDIRATCLDTHCANQHIHPLPHTLPRRPDVSISCSSMPTIAHSCRIIQIRPLKKYPASCTLSHDHSCRVIACAGAHARVTGLQLLDVRSHTALRFRRLPAVHTYCPCTCCLHRTISVSALCAPDARTSTRET